MKARSRTNTKTLTLCVAAALTQMATMMAHADSASGVDTVIGNALNARPVNTATNGGKVDPDGMGTNVPVAHTPTGQMYNMPITANTQLGKTANGWDYIGHVEAGVIGVSGDKNAHGFRRYKDLDGSVYLNNFGLSMEKKESANFFEVTGGGVAKDDQFYSMSFGRYNDWKFNAFYNETAHVFSTTYRSLHNGVGTGNLTLSGAATAAGLRPGGVAAGAFAYTIAGTQALAATALQNTNNEAIGLVREKGGLRFDMKFADDWKFYASYSNEKRVGARPFAVVSQATGGGAQSTELAEPINYNTHELLAGLSYADDLNSLNVAMSASYFRNNIGTLTFENPWATAAANGVTAANGGWANGTVDLYPNNDYYNLKGEYARLLPGLYNGRFTAVVSVSSSRQNDALLPYTNNANVTSGATIVSAVPWTSTAALSKQNAGAKIDTTLIDLGLALNPTNELAVKGRIRSYETDNSTLFTNCNPNATYAGAEAGTPTLTYNGCTGVWGRFAGDGTGLAFLLPVTRTIGGNQDYMNSAWDRKELLYSLSGDYRLSNLASINASYERESIKRSHRERDETWEDKFKLGYVNRGIMEDGSLRVSYEIDKRGGSTYNANPYSSNMGGAILTANGIAPLAATNLATGYIGNRNAGGRKFDLADRDQDILNVRYQHVFRSDLDGNASLQLKAMDYGSWFGRVGKEKQDSFNLDLNYQPSAETNVYGFYSYQIAQMKQRGTAAVAPVPACTGAGGYNMALLGTGLAGDPLRCMDPAFGAASQWNPANSWEVDHKEATDTFGFGFKHDFAKAVLDVSFTRSIGKTAISYNGIGTSAAGAAFGGGHFPDMKTETDTLEANLMIPINTGTSARLMYRYEGGKIEDWHYQGNVQGNLGTTSILTDGGPQSYGAHVLGVLFNFKM